MWSGWRQKIFLKNRGWNPFSSPHHHHRRCAQPRGGRKRRKNYFKWKNGEDATKTSQSILILRNIIGERDEMSKKQVGWKCVASLGGCGTINIRKKRERETVDEKTILRLKCFVDGWGNEGCRWLLGGSRCVITLPHILKTFDEKFKILLGSEMEDEWKLQWTKQGRLKSGKSCYEGSIEGESRRKSVHKREKKWRKRRLWADDNKFQIRLW